MMHVYVHGWCVWIVGLTGMGGWLVTGGVMIDVGESCVDAYHIGLYNPTAVTLTSMCISFGVTHQGTPRKNVFQLVCTPLSIEHIQPLRFALSLYDNPPREYGQ